MPQPALLVGGPVLPRPSRDFAHPPQELAKLMLSRKKQRLYERMQYGIKKKAAAAEVLKQKRATINQQAGEKKPKAKRGKKA